MELVDFINIGSIIATACTGYIGAILYKKQGFVEEQSRKILSQDNELEKKNKRILVLKKFCETVSTSESKEHNVIVIGPRASGKSSIISLWCEIDRLIETISPTVSFDTYDYDTQTSSREEFFDEQIDVKRIKEVKRVVKIFDYAGEDDQIPNAIDNITESPDCTIVMVFNSDSGYANDNRRYFSRSLIEKINTAFNQTGFKTSSVKGVYLVFNKIDLFDSVGGNYDKLLCKVIENFEDNITNIESIFGVEVRYMVTSALTNHNIVNLLQKVVRSYDK